MNNDREFIVSDVHDGVIYGSVLIPVRVCLPKSKNKQKSPDETRTDEDIIGRVKAGSRVSVGFNKAWLWAESGVHAAEVTIDGEKL